MKLKLLAVTLAAGATAVAVAAAATDARAGAVGCADLPKLCAESPPTFDAALDDDLFVLSAMAGDICVQAREMHEDGLSVDDIQDAAVDVFLEQGIIATEEAGMYLAGLVRGCLT